MRRCWPLFLAITLAACGPVATGGRLLDSQNVRSATKLVVILLLLLLEEGLLNHSPRHTAFKGLPDKLVPIEPWTPDGEK